VDTQRLRVLIAERYNQLTSATAREWALFFELRNGTGYAAQGTNYADAFALNLWPTKKHWRLSFEFKISRSDFLRELNKPEKRQWAWDISNEFWFVCAPGVAKKEEIPEGCGLLEADAQGTKLKRVVVAKQRKARELTMSEIAAIARRSVENEGLSDLRWRLAGLELDAQGLDALLDERLEAHREARDTEYVDKAVDAALKKIQDRLDTYVIQMEKAKIEPPGWMRDFRRAGVDSYGFDRWVEENVYPGPNALELRQTLVAHKRHVDSLESMLGQARAAQISLTSLLQRKESELVAGAVKGGQGGTPASLGKTAELDDLI
jgi:hypothetical protein